jgi:hypothetical protein
MFKTLNGTVLVVPGREKHTEKGGGEATSLNALNRLPCTCHVETIHVYYCTHVCAHTCTHVVRVTKCMINRISYASRVCTTCVHMYHVPRVPLVNSLKITKVRVLPGTIFKICNVDQESYYEV